MHPKIEEFAANEKIKAREFSCDAQIYLLTLGQLLHLFSLNELVDVSQIYASELSRIRGIVPAKLNTFSNANRTRNPEVIEKFFWHVYEMPKKDNPGFVQWTSCSPRSRKATSPSSTAPTTPSRSHTATTSAVASSSSAGRTG